MTREELKEHCEKQIENCEIWAAYKGQEPHGKIYEEHKLILELLEQEPKTGHWIKGYTFPDGAYWKCDKCNELIKVKIPMHYCNNCGAKMVEPQESEVEDGNVDN